MTTLEDIARRLAVIEGLLRGGAPAADGRAARCTQAEFDRLPALVSRQTFCDWTGYESHELGREVKGGAVRTYKAEGRTKARYYKAEIARLGGWRM